MEEQSLTTFKPSKGVAFIFNPVSNKGQSKIVMEKYKQTIKNLFDVPTYILETQKAGGGYDRAREAVTELNCDLVVACGGDGTLNEVLNGILDPKTKQPRAAMGMIGMGTGNDFRKTIGFAKTENIEEYLKALTEGRTIKIDFGELQTTHIEDIEKDKDGEEEEDEEEQQENDQEEGVEKPTKRAFKKRRYFINECSYGLGGAVMRAINAQKSHPFGKDISFKFQSVYQQFAYSNTPTVMHFDENDPVQMIKKIGAVCNGRYFGSGMMVAPRARVDSGQFEITCIGDVGILESIPILRDFYTGEHIKHPKVHTMSCKRFRIAPLKVKDQVYVECDGELFGQLPIEAVIHPQTLQFIVPADYMAHQPPLPNREK